MAESLILKISQKVLGHTLEFGRIWPDGRQFGPDPLELSGRDHLHGPGYLLDVLDASDFTFYLTTA